MVSLINDSWPLGKGSGRGRQAMEKLNDFLSKPIADILKGSGEDDSGNTFPKSAVASALLLYQVSGFLNIYPLG